MSRLKSMECHNLTRKIHEIIFAEKSKRTEADSSLTLLREIYDRMSEMVSSDPLIFASSKNDDQKYEIIEAQSVLQSSPLIVDLSQNDDEDVFGSQELCRLVDEPEPKVIKKKKAEIRFSEVVRNKEKRKTMHASDCPCCHSVNHKKIFIFNR
jgi:hypothetical protein